MCIIRLLGKLRADKSGGMSAGTLVSAVSTDKPKKLLDRVRDVMRLKHHSLRTDQAYADWSGSRPFRPQRNGTRRRHERDYANLEPTFATSEMCLISPKLGIA